VLWRHQKWHEYIDIAHNIAPSVVTLIVPYENIAMHKKEDSKLLKPMV